MKVRYWLEVAGVWLMMLVFGTDAVQRAARQVLRCEGCGARIQKSVFVSNDDYELCRDCWDELETEHSMNHSELKAEDWSGRVND